MENVALSICTKNKHNVPHNTRLMMIQSKAVGWQGLMPDEEELAERPDFWEPEPEKEPPPVVGPKMTGADRNIFLRGNVKEPPEPMPSRGDLPQIEPPKPRQKITPPKLENGAGQPKFWEKKPEPKRPKSEILPITPELKKEWELREKEWMEHPYSKSKSIVQAQIFIELSDKDKAKLPEGVYNMLKLAYEQELEAAKQRFKDPRFAVMYQSFMDSASFGILTDLNRRSSFRSDDYIYAELLKDRYGDSAAVGEALSLVVPVGAVAKGLSKGGKVAKAAKGGKTAKKVTRKVGRKGKVAGKTADKIEIPKAKVAEILETPKGQRADPSTYLSKTQISRHLKPFEKGVTRIVAKAPTGTAGPKGGTFVMPSSVADDLIAKASGDITKLEQSLGFPKGSLGSSPVRVDIQKPTGLRIPSGNEPGVNRQWIPGGHTSGGISEAIIDSPTVSQYTIKPIK